jgi:protein involved in polysaccharide export with SLBB domain
MTCLPDYAAIRKTGVDIYYGRSPGDAKPRLNTSGMQFQPLSQSTGWQSDLKTVRHALMVASPYALTASETAPLAFRTGDGGMGILRIVKVTDSPPRVTIRYKLLQAGPAAATQPATQPAWSETTQKAAEALRTDVAHFSLELRAAMWSQEGVGRLGNRSVVMDTVLLLSVLEEKVKGQSRARVVDKVHALKIIDLLTEQGWLEARQAYKPAEKEPYWVLKFGGTEPVQTSLRAGDANAVRLLKTIRDLLGKDDGAAVDEAINSGMRTATQPAPTDTEAQEFYIIGEVERSGVYSLGGRRITVKMALASAGFAMGKKKDMAVVLIRRLNDSSEQQVVLNVDALIAGGQQDVLLRKGDVVVVQPAKDVLDDNAKWGAPRPALNPTASSQPADTASPSATTAKALGLDGDAGQEVPPHAVQPAKADLFYGRDEKPGGAVTILGGVNRSGKYSIDANGMRIADALAKAGYVSQTSIRYAYVVRQGPGAKPIAVDLPKLMDGDPRVNVVLRDGDTVFVPPVVPGEFYIMGEVDRPGVYSLTGRKINVKMALAAAGFPLGKKRDMIVVLVRRKGDGSEQRQTLNVDAILAGAEQDIVLQRDDLLMVRPAKDAATSTSSGQAAQSATQPAPAKGSGHATDANTVSVLGSVPRPGTYPLSAVGTVRKLLLSCGYKQVGKWDRLYIIHPADRQNVKWVVDPQKVLDGSANDIPLAAGEILFVEDVRKTMNRDAEPATRPATLSWGKGPVRIQQGDSVIEGKRIAIEDGHMQVEGNAILKANNGAEVKADRIDIRPNAAATRPATNGAGTQVVPQSGGNEAGKLTVQGVARDAFAAYERARKDQHHLHIVASTRKLERPAGGDWRATPEQSRTWSWWESPTGGRRRVDYDPEICEWIAGAAPYCETRYLFTFDGKEFRKVDFIYDEHLGLYGARVSERYPHDKPTYFAQTHWATGLVFMAQPPGACERCEQIPNNSVKELTRFSSISDTPLTTARHIQEADRRLIEIKVEVTKPMRMAELIVLDPARGHSLVRSQYWQDGRLEREFAVHEWKQLSDNLWFPMYWTTENGSPEPGKRLKVEYRATVAEYYDPTQSDAIFGLRDVVFGKPLAYPPHGSARKNAAPATQPAPSTASGQTPNGTSTQPGGKINVE